MYLGKMNCKGFLSHRIHKHSTKNKPHISLKWHSMVWTFDQGLYFKMNNHHRHLENSVLTCSWTICGCVPWQLLDKKPKISTKRLLLHCTTRFFCPLYMQGSDTNMHDDEYKDDRSHYYLVVLMTRMMLTKITEYNDDMMMMMMMIMMIMMTVSQLNIFTHILR